MSAFTDLLDRIASLEPRGGWSDVRQLPELSDADLAAIAEEELVHIVDAADCGAFARSVIEELRKAHEPLKRYALIGAAYVGHLQSIARHYVLRELRLQAERLEEERGEVRRQDAADLAAEDAGVSRGAEL